MQSVIEEMQYRKIEIIVRAYRQTRTHYRELHWRESQNHITTYVCPYTQAHTSQTHFKIGFRRQL